MVVWVNDLRRARGEGLRIHAGGRFPICPVYVRVPEGLKAYLMFRKWERFNGWAMGPIWEGAGRVLDGSAQRGRGCAPRRQRIWGG